MKQKRREGNVVVVALGVHIHCTGFDGAVGRRMGHATCWTPPRFVCYCIDDHSDCYTNVREEIMHVKLV